jgi:uncharacterized protein (TIGR03083 family)
MTTMDLAREEREDFAAFLAELSPEQWDMPTLCERWRVRDVVAHVFSYEELGRPALVRRFIAGGLSVNPTNALGVADHAALAPDQLLDIARRHGQPEGLTAGFGGRIALTDGMIHQQDIRRPLGLPRTIPPRRLRAALDFARYAPTIRGAWQARGVRLVATDMAWSHGSGPEVRGPGEALLMAMAARPDALRDLSGPGQPRLAQHIGT